MTPFRRGGPGAAVVAELAARVRAMTGGTGRVMLGITGPPGSGKSTLAGLIADAVAADVPVAHVPMDGYHLADSVLDALDRRHRKGAIDTFDGHGYLALLRRLRGETGHTVYAPGFDRAIEQPVAGSIPVAPEVRLVVTEGNYLLAPEPPWREVRVELDEVWWCDLGDAERRNRLVERHVRFGKTRAEAVAWVDDVDEMNARAVARWRDGADRVVDMGAPAPGLTGAVSSLGR